MPMSGRNPKVVVVGAVYIDMAVRCPRIPSPGQTLAGSALSYAATGPGVNQAAQAALCGCEVHLIAKVGDDPFGKMIKSALAETRICTGRVCVAEAKRTGVIVTLVDASGENTSVSYDGANHSLLPADIEAAEEVFADAQVCLIHGRLPKDAVARAIGVAKLHGLKVILDPAGSVGPETENMGQTLPAEYFSADIMIPNLYEAGLITEHSTANIRTAKLVGSDLIARGVGSAVITMGKRGCMVVDRNGADHIEAFAIDLVDSTGTGDAFAGALAAACAVGDELRAAVKFASAAGALACTKFGSVEAMPTKAEIIELLQKQEGE